MSGRVFNFSDIDLTGGVRYGGEAIGSVHYNGERLWPFGPDLLYLGGIGGASYLPDAADVFPDPASSQAATAFGGSVGLVLDEKNGLPALGPELVTNGGFSVDSNWSKLNGATIAGGVATLFNPSQIPGLTQTLNLPLQRTYFVSLSWTGTLTAGIGAYGSGDVRFINASTAGSFSGYVTLFAGTGSTIWFQSPVNVSTTIDNVSIREVIGLPARQPSASLRPLLGRAPKAGCRNLLTRTEEFGNAVWQQSNITRVDNVADPIGGNAAVRLTANAGTVTFQQIGASVTAVDAVSSLWIRRVSGSGNILLILPNGGTSLPLAITAEWQRFSGVILNWTGAMFAGVRIATSGDVIEVAFPQGEVGAAPTPYQRVGAAVDVTEAGVPSYPFIRPDLADDRLDSVLPQAVSGDVVIAGRNGSIIAPHSYAANTTWQLGSTTYTGGTPGILRGIGDIVGWSIFNKTLSAAERERLMRFYKRRGAKGLLVPGPELVVNGGFDTAANWEFTSAHWQISGGKLQGLASGIPFDARQSGGRTVLEVGRTYLYTCQCTEYVSGSWQFANFGTNGFNNIGVGTFAEIHTNVTNEPSVRIRSAAGFVGAIDNISVRELRAEEEW